MKKLLHQVLAIFFDSRSKEEQQAPARELSPEAIAKPPDGWQIPDEFVESPYMENQYRESPDNNCLAVIYEIEELAYGQYAGRLNVLIQTKSSRKKLASDSGTNRLFEDAPWVYIIGVESCGFLWTGHHLWFCERFGSKQVLYALIVDLKEEKFAFYPLLREEGAQAIKKKIASIKKSALKWNPLSDWESRGKLIRKAQEESEVTWRDVWEELADESLRKYKNMKIKSLFGLIQSNQIDDTTMIWEAVAERCDLNTAKATLLQYLENAPPGIQKFHCARVLILLVLKHNTAEKILTENDRGHVAIRYDDYLFSPYTLGYLQAKTSPQDYMRALRSFLDRF